MKPSLTPSMKNDIPPMTEEVLPEMGNLFKQGKTGNLYDPYHPLEPQWRNTIHTEMKRVQNWGVYIDDGIYHRHERTMIAKMSEILREAQLDLINSGAECQP